MGICHAKSQNDHVIEQSVDAAYLSIKHWNWGPQCSWTPSHWSFWHPDHQHYQSKHHLFLFLSVILR